MRTTPEDESLSASPLLCGHGAAAQRRGPHRAACAVCGSFWDLETLRTSPAYDADYPDLRAHHDPAVGDSKVATLRGWLDANRITLDGRVVCEVGFGGGQCLQELDAKALRAFGIEAVAENLEHARRLGVAPEALFRADALPPRLPASVDLWLFLDSFEHVERPTELLRWLRVNSTPDARVLLVAPEAGSRSERLLGRWWPHKLPDHAFHWSRAGLVEFFARQGFAVESTFSPTKVLSLRTVVAHGVHQLRLGALWRPSWTLALPPWSLRFNLGEMGVVFRRRADE